MKTRPDWITPAIRAGQPFHFRRQNPLLHNLRNLLCLAGLLGSIAGLIYLGGQLSPWLYVPLAGIGFGVLYFGLMILVVHEASHGMFLVAKDRGLEKSLNRSFGWAVSSSIAASHYVKHWEEGHLEHHIRPLEEKDPQRFNVHVGRPLWTTVMLNGFVPGYLFLERTVLRKRKSGGRVSTSSKGVILYFIAFWTVSLTLVSLMVSWASAVAMFWGLHVLSVWNHVKGALEHGGEVGKAANPFLRSRSSFFLGRRLLMPFNITMHFEHHLNFCVPWYRLPAYHRALGQVVPKGVWNAAVNARPAKQLRGKLGPVPAT